jgi:hypothetical protein
VLAILVVIEPTSTTLRALDRAARRSSRLPLNCPICMFHLEEALSYRQSRISSTSSCSAAPASCPPAATAPGPTTRDQEAPEIAREFLDHVEESLARVRVADDCVEPT